MGIKRFIRLVDSISQDDGTQISRALIFRNTKHACTARWFEELRDGDDDGGNDRVNWTGPFRCNNPGFRALPVFN